MKIFYAAAFLLILAAANAQPLNAKSIDSVEVAITYTGSLNVVGNVQRANITYYIPQEGLVLLDVSSNRDMSWNYVYDGYGNRLVLVEWDKPTGLVTYRIDMNVRNNAKHSYADKAIGTNDNYLRQTQYVKISDSIRQASFPYEKSLRKAAELAKFVYDYMIYDLSYVGKNVPSDEAFRLPRGVCVEHANLLAAMLRANEIPTRYVVGYAYSPQQDKFIGHTWVEVLLVDGTWVPLDPTWLQAGYLDATHIKSAALLDNSQIDTLTYIGGSINWTRNEEQFNVLDYTEKNITTIEASGAGEGQSGYIKADIGTNECTIVTINALSCVDNRGLPQLQIFEPNRTVWACAPASVYWFYNAAGSNYVCPVVVYDQTGSKDNYDVRVSGTKTQNDAYISGPSTVTAGEEFTLTANSDGLFYSPEFGVNAGRTWTLKISKEGGHRFYLYGNGLYLKDVDVFQKREFVVNGTVPVTAKLGDTFNVSLTVKNLLSPKNVKIKLRYTNQTINKDEFFAAGQEKKFTFVLTANAEGPNDLLITVSGDTLYSETIRITTPTRQRGIFDIIAGFFAWLASLF